MNHPELGASLGTLLVNPDTPVYLVFSGPAMSVCARTTDITLRDAHCHAWSVVFHDIPDKRWRPNPAPGPMTLPGVRKGAKPFLCDRVHLSAGASGLIYPASFLALLPGFWESVVVTSN